MRREKWQRAKSHSFLNAKLEVNVLTLIKVNVLTFYIVFLWVLLVFGGLVVLGFVSWDLFITEALLQVVFFCMLILQRNIVSNKVCWVSKSKKLGLERQYPQVFSVYGDLAK